MAVGLLSPGFVADVAGFRLATAACGLKNTGKPDLLLVSMTPETTVAGVFTQNRVVAAPVVLSRERLVQGYARALVVNSGNANACTGSRGLQVAQILTQAAADALHVPSELVFVASTGVIGEPLPVERPVGVLPAMATRLVEGWREAAIAIMTTDTLPKVFSRHIHLAGRPVSLVGIAKGAGMIHPNMATMLAFIFTDAAVKPTLLQALLGEAVACSFNRISVDGDTSTNDTLMVFASGKSGIPILADAHSPETALFAEALTSVCQDLAQAIVRDGEGATKFITITVEGADHAVQAKQVAMSIAKSPLVKTACAGSDPNWGRILAAVGYAGVAIVAEDIDLFLGDVQVVKSGMRSPDYTEERGKMVMSQDEISLRIRLGQGPGSATVWTCDLTHEYIAINADYRS